MKSHNIILCFHGKLIADIKKESRNTRLQVFISCLVKGELPIRWIGHSSNNVDTPIIIIEIETVHPLLVFLPHNPLVWEHLPDELREFEPESDGFADGKVTIAAITAGIHNDTLILLMERRIESTLKISGMSTYITIKHKFVFSINHCNIYYRLSCVSTKSCGRFI